MSETAMTIGAMRARGAPVLQRAPLAPLRPDICEAPVLGRLGGLEVRLARGPAEIRAAQSLRYRVFYGEMNAKANVVQQLTRLDSDRFDRHCDHLLVMDPSRGTSFKDRVVGTYRLLREESAAQAGSFYSAGEYAVGDLVARHPALRFLELGRSCVLKEYRGKRTVELLWQGVWAYVLTHRIDVLFGCASLPGTAPCDLAAPLAFLRANATAPAQWQVAAAKGRGIELPEGGCDNARAAMSCLPPLLKGYLRVGGMVSREAVVDEAFGTTDVLVVLPVERIAPRYVAHYGAGAERFS